MFLKRAVLSLTLFWGLAAIKSQSDNRAVVVRIYGVSGTDGNLTDVESTAVSLEVRCVSSIGPTEWVYDIDYTNITSPKFPCESSEWIYRWHSTKGYQNQSSVGLSCDKFETSLAMGCRSVYNHSDNVMVKLEPNHTTGRLYITKERGAWKEYEPPKATNCVRFTLAQTRGSNYWKCEGPDGNRGKASIRHCSSSLGCANLQRKLKLQPVCVNLTDQKNLDDIAPHWEAMRAGVTAKYPAGVITCELDSGKHRGAAVEYFFVGRDRSNFHFSLNEISMSDFIWFDPAPANSTMYYTKDKFESVCKTTHYGMGYDSRGLVKLNGSVVMREDRPRNEENDTGKTMVLKVTIDFEGFGPGAYEVVCSAPVWNTSEWASQTLKFHVYDVVPPHFVTDHEHVIVNQGDANVRLHCDVQGDPAPDDITWSHSTVPGFRLEGRELIFTSVRDKWVNGSTVSCTAGNKFGQQATKKFSMHIKLADGPGRSDSSNSIGTVLPSMVVGTILLGVVFGFAALYWRFVRLGRAVTQVLSDEEMKEFQRWKAASPNTEIDDRLVIY